MLSEYARERMLLRECPRDKEEVLNCFSFSFTELLYKVVYFFLRVVEVAGDPHPTHGRGVAHGYQHLVVEQTREVTVPGKIFPTKVQRTSEVRCT